MTPHKHKMFQNHGWLQQDSIPKSVKQVAMFMIDNKLVLFWLNQLLEYLVKIKIRIQ
jgi:hypothetical protein